MRCPAATAPSSSIAGRGSLTSIVAMSRARRVKSGSGAPGVPPRSPKWPVNATSRIHRTGNPVASAPTSPGGGSAPAGIGAPGPATCTGCSKLVDSVHWISYSGHCPLIIFAGGTVMTSKMTPLLEHNAQFARTFTPLPLGLPAAHVIVITCLDHRVDPAITLGLRLGDAAVLDRKSTRLNSS